MKEHKVNEETLLDPGQTWADRNIADPLRESLIKNVYEPVANTVNFCSKSVAGADVLPKAIQTPPKEAPRNAFEYGTRLLVHGLVGAGTYAICGKAAGKLLSGTSMAANLNGSLANILSSESTGMIVGAGIHDFCLTANDAQERSANVLGGMASFAVFEGLNKALPGSGSLLKNLALQPSIGMAGGAVGYLTHETVAGKKLDANGFAQSVMDGAALSLLMPAAKWGATKMLGQTNTASAATETSVLSTSRSRQTDSSQLGANWVEAPISIGPDVLTAVQNPAIQAMHRSLRKQATLAVLHATSEKAYELHGSRDPEFLSYANGEMARRMPAEDVHTALALLQANRAKDLHSRNAELYLSSISALSAETGRDAVTTHKALVSIAEHTAIQRGNFKPTAETPNIQSLSQLESNIVPYTGETKSQVMQVVLSSASSLLAAFEANKIPMTALTKPSIAAPVFNYLSSSIGNMQSPEAHNRLQTLGRAFKADLPLNENSLKAMSLYAEAGGSLEHLDSRRSALATSSYEALGRVSPVAIEIAAARGYHSNGSSIPWNELERHSAPYVTGKVSDYRLSNIVGKLVDNKIPVSKKNVWLATEHVSQNDGYMDMDHFRGILKVADKTQSSDSAPNIYNAFAAAIAEQNSINTSNLSPSEIMRELNAINISPAQVTDKISYVQRRSGAAFSDKALQDPTTIHMLLEASEGGSPFALQAIHAVTELLGPTETLANPRAVAFAEEFLSKGNRISDLTYQTLISAMRDQH